MTNARGGALSETALMVSAALLMILGTIQIGLLGAVQMVSDSASYYDARLNVMTVGSNTPEYWTNQQFPQVPVPDISPTVIPAASPTIPVDYGYNDPNPVVVADSPYNRHGGASMLQPAVAAVTVNVPGVTTILGQGLGANSVSGESEWQECGTHFDIANVGCSLASPPPNSQTNYFHQGENTPPYMVGFNYMQHCTLSPPYGLYNPATGGNSTAPESATSWRYPSAVYGSFTIAGAFNTSTGYGWQGPCSSSGGGSDFDYIAMGTAEFLNVANWSNTGPGGAGTGAGISGPCDNTAQSGSIAGLEAADQNVFCAIWWHQRVYADLANYFTLNPNQYSVELFSQAYDYNPGSLNFNYNKKNQFGCTGTGTCPGGSWTNPYAFGNVDTAVGYRVGNGNSTGNVWAVPEPILTFEDWEGFDDMNYGPNYASPLAPTSRADRWNQDVQIIYSWDVAVTAGNPPDDPNYNNPTDALNGAGTF